MYQRIITSLLFSLLSLTSLCQAISKEDSVQINHLVQKVFKVFEEPMIDQFRELSTESIYCILCFPATDFSKKPYMLSREKFFNFLSSKNFLEQIKLAQQSQDIIYTKSKGDYRSDVIVLFTIPNKLESTLSQQLGIYFKGSKGKFKFSGIEILP